MRAVPWKLARLRRAARGLRLGAALGLGSLVLGGSGAGCGSAPVAAPVAAPPVPVRVLTVEAAPFEEEEVALGVLVAPDSVELRPEQTGLVRSVHFEDGETVRKGALLVRLQDANAQAALLDAHSRATLARLNLDRTRALLDRADVSQAELDRAAAEDGLARAMVIKATEDLRRTTIVAPFSGIMGRREVTPGQLVDPSRVLGRIESLEALAVDLSLPEAALSRLAVGQKAKITVDAANGETFLGAVTFLSPRVREDSRTVDLRLRLEAADPRLRPGMSASVRVVTAEQPAGLLVPTEAVVMSGARASVWVLGVDGAVALRPIEAGQRSRASVQVRAGLEAGEQVIIEGLARMKPGVKAVVAAPAEAPAAGAAAPAAGAPPKASP